MEIRGWPEHQFLISDTPQAVWQKAAALFAGVAAQAIAARGRFTTVLAGGSTPRGLYALLADDKHGLLIDWENVFIFWGDERCVPPDHADSNYRLAHDTLLSKIPVPGRNIFPMVTGNEPPAAAAAAYEQQLVRFFGLSTGVPPAFDLILLGLGPDGHTASLFPGSPAVDENRALVTAIHAGPQAGYRLTLTLPVLNAAVRTLFLVTGESKAAVLYDLVTGQSQTGIMPASLVRPAGELLLLADKQAAKYFL